MVASPAEGLEHSFHYLVKVMLEEQDHTACLFLLLQHALYVYLWLTTGAQHSVDRFHARVAAVRMWRSLRVHLHPRSVAQ